MNEFNLEKALAGEPVVLRDGRKAWVIYDARANSEVRGVAPIKVLTVDNGIYGVFTDGTYHTTVPHRLDIIGMWEEPKPTIRIGDIDVPEPERTPLTNGAKYYIPTLSRRCTEIGYLWNGDGFDMTQLKRGFVHKTREAAEQHAKALIALTASKDD